MSLVFFNQTPFTSIATGQQQQNATRLKQKVCQYLYLGKRKKRKEDIDKEREEENKPMKKLKKIFRFMEKICSVSPCTDRHRERERKKSGCCCSNKKKIESIG